MREGPQKHARLAGREHHDDQGRPGLAGFHGEAVGVYDSRAELIPHGAAQRASEVLFQPGHSRVLPVSAAVLGSGAPRLGGLTEEPLGGALATLPECYAPATGVRQRWKGIVRDCAARVFPGGAQAERPHHCRPQH
eukprot:9298561-Pyramimonas_sp.AAC.1